MPPRLNICRVGRPLAIRPRLLVLSHKPRLLPVVSRRGLVEGRNSDLSRGTNQDVLGSVSQEAADIGRVTGRSGPDLAQGTPVQDILKRDSMGKENGTNDGTTQLEGAEPTSLANLYAMRQMENIAEGGHGTDPVVLGHKFGLPDLPIPPNANLKYRYDPVVTQVTKLLMKDGKLGVAQRNMAFILNHLRTSPPPSPNPARPLLSGFPPPSQLPLHPIAYLTLAIDSVAPLLRLKSIKGAAGGGTSLQIPVPLGLRQRRRKAMEWILDSADKRASRGSGKNQFALRVADEIIAVVEGRSGVWEKRQLVHKTGTAARSNMNRKKFNRRR